MPIRIEVKFANGTRKNVPFEAMPRAGERIATKNDDGQLVYWLVAGVVHYPGGQDYQASIKVSPM